MRRSAALLALAATGLVGEVFYAGAVAISLTHPHDGHPPSLREIARMVDYGPLIAIDLIYGAAVAVGLVFFVVPGHRRLRLARPGGAGGRDRAPRRPRRPRPQRAGWCAGSSSWSPP